MQILKIGKLLNRLWILPPVKDCDDLKNVVLIVKKKYDADNVNLFSATSK